MLLRLLPRLRYSLSLSLSPPPSLHFSQRFLSFARNLTRLQFIPRSRRPVRLSRRRDINEPNSECYGNGELPGRRRSDVEHPPHGVLLLSIRLWIRRRRLALTMVVMAIVAVLLRGLLTNTSPGAHKILTVPFVNYSPRSRRTCTSFVRRRFQSPRYPLRWCPLRRQPHRLLGCRPYTRIGFDRYPLARWSLMTRKGSLYRTCAREREKER
jgi:hypothetical protein